MNRATLWLYSMFDWQGRYITKRRNMRYYLLNTHMRYRDNYDHIKNPLSTKLTPAEHKLFYHIAWYKTAKWINEFLQT